MLSWMEEELHYKREVMVANRVSKYYISFEEVQKLHPVCVFTWSAHIVFDRRKLWVAFCRTWVPVRNHTELPCCLVRYCLDSGLLCTWDSRPVPVEDSCLHQCVVWSSGRGVIGWSLIRGHIETSIHHLQEQQREKVLRMMCVLRDNPLHIQQSKTVSAFRLEVKTNFTGMCSLYPFDLPSY